MQIRTMGLSLLFIILGFTQILPAKALTALCTMYNSELNTYVVRATSREETSYVCRNKKIEFTLNGWGSFNVGLHLSNPYDDGGGALILHCPTISSRQLLKKGDRKLGVLRADVGGLLVGAGAEVGLDNRGNFCTLIKANVGRIGAQVGTGVYRIIQVEKI